MLKKFIKKFKNKKLINDMVAPHIIYIISKLQDAGYETYLVGGAIRDILMNREPKDYDISTSATPPQIRKVFGKRRSRIVGRRFKIVHLYHGREIIEISTFRAPPEIPTENKVQPIHRDNQYGTSYDDAFRRDFTVNAVFYDPSKEKFIDYTKSGLKDLKAGVVRVIGEPSVRFSEDPARVLRALKLVGQYDFTLTKATAEALKASLEQITLCSKSRLTLELEKILRKPYSTKILHVFQDYTFLQYFLPNVADRWETESAQMMLKLLSTNCQRVLLEECQSYLSTILALMSIPFVNQHFTNDPSNCFWDYYIGIEKDVKNIIQDLFYPHNFPRYIITATTDAIMLLQRFHSKRNVSRTQHHAHFRIARDVAIDINNTIWQKPDLNDFWKPKRKKH